MCFLAFSYFQKLFLNKDFFYYFHVFLFVKTWILWYFNNLEYKKTIFLKATFQKYILKATPK